MFESRGIEEQHKASLAAFQLGEGRFVWGLEKATKQLWYLDENTAIESRDFVNDHVVCPVPDCGAQLTTAHRTKKRDGLQHFSGAGGHSRESIFHSQGCALIEDWLRRTYPRSTARREEYTNDEGERRADVLLTGPGNHRIAFEVQYSPISPDSWRRRHESYRRQGIVDVWLFGHTSRHLRKSPDGILRVNPTHEEVVRSGQALMFLNPDQGLVGTAVGISHPYDVTAESHRPDEVQVFDELGSARLQTRLLIDLRVSATLGLGGEWLESLYSRTAALNTYNSAALTKIEGNRERRRQEQDAKQRTWEIRRRPQQAQIRELLGAVDRWSKSDAFKEIRSYFGDHLKGRIEYHLDPNSPPELLVRWQCIIYFDLIAGSAQPFGAREAFRAIERRNVGMNINGFKQVVRYLYRLERDGFIRQLPGSGRYPMYSSTTSGSWW